MTQDKARSPSPAKASASAPAPASASAPAPAAPAVDLDLGRKVFFGNLSFATTDEILSEFGRPFGTIVNALVVTRGARSLGYGFLTYETEAMASKAVSGLNGLELDGRPIDTELALPQDQLKTRSAGAGRGARGARGRGGAGRARGGRGRGGRPQGGARIDDENQDDIQGSNYPDVDAEYADGAAPRGRGRGRGYRGADRGADRGAPRVRAPRPAKGEPEGEDSDTLIFCGNLPWGLTENDLGDMFKEYDVTGSVVSRLRSGRSKGFGFVQLGSREKQQQVLSDLKNITVDGRELTIKVAKKIQEQALASDKPEEAIA